MLRIRVHNALLPVFDLLRCRWLGHAGRAERGADAGKSSALETQISLISLFVFLTRLSFRTAGLGFRRLPLRRSYRCSSLQSASSSCPGNMRRPRCHFFSLHSINCFALAARYAPMHKALATARTLHAAAAEQYWQKA